MGYVITHLSDEHLSQCLREAREAYREAESELASCRAILDAFEQERSRRWRQGFAEMITVPRLPAPVSPPPPAGEVR
jgi:hypothetical protein